VCARNGTCHVYGIDVIARNVVCCSNVPSTAGLCVDAVLKHIAGQLQQGINVVAVNVGQRLPASGSTTAAAALIFGSTYTPVPAV
jgi:hypothetical protein